MKSLEELFAHSLKTEDEEVALRLINEVANDSRYSANAISEFLTKERRYWNPGDDAQKAFLALIWNKGRDIKQLFDVAFTLCMQVNDASSLYSDWYGDRGTGILASSVATASIAQTLTLVNFCLEGDARRQLFDGIAHKLLNSFELPMDSYAYHLKQMLIGSIRAKNAGWDWSDFVKCVRLLGRLVEEVGL